MNAYTEIEVGGKGLKYIRERLNNGLTLSHCLLERGDLDEGVVTTCLPSYVSADEAKRDLADGILGEPPPETHIRGRDGSVSVPKRTMDWWLVRVVRRFLEGHGGRCCLLENACAKPGDPCLTRKRTRNLSFGDEVYHILFDCDANEGMIEETIRTASSWLFTGVLTFVDTRDRKLLIEENRITSVQLETLADKAERLICGAYDGEGYLIWRKPGADVTETCDLVPPNEW